MPFRNNIDLKGVSQTDIYMAIERLWDSKKPRARDTILCERMSNREKVRERDNIYIYICMYACVWMISKEFKWFSRI